MVQRHGIRRPPQPPKLLEQARAVIRARHYSLRTAETSLGWMKRFILFHGKRHPRDMGMQEVQQCLSHLAVEGHVAASTQSQALSALVFLYQQVLNQDIGGLDEVVRAKQPHRVPVVFTQDEVTAVLRHLSGTSWMMATLLDGAGLRLVECLRLRVKDVDFPSNHIIVRDGKGHQDRVTMLPQQVKAPLQRHLHDVQQLHGQDLQAGGGHVYLPYALERKYPNARHAWGVAICFLLPDCRATRGRGSSGDITSTDWSCSEPCRLPSGGRRSPRQQVVILYGTPLGPICSKQDTTSGPSRNSSGTETCGQR